MMHAFTNGCFLFKCNDVKEAHYNMMNIFCYRTTLCWPDKPEGHVVVWVQSLGIVL